jgi:hypothetical protein
MEPHEGEVIRIALLAGDDGVIRNSTFERCDIKGPAVIIPQGECAFEHNRLDGDEEGIFWEIGPDRQTALGAIAVVNCRFTGCHFMNVGIAGPPELIAQFKG